MAEDDFDQGEDFFWSSDADSDIEVEHDLQARLENKGKEFEEAESEEENDESSEEDLNEGNTGMGKSFSEAFSKIIEKNTAKDGPLSQYKAPIKRIEEQLLEKKIRSVVSARKKQKLEKGHITPEQFSNYEQERKFKNAARKGVVNMFNAVNKHQKILAKEIGDPSRVNPDAMEALSKEKFFEILQTTNAPAATGMTREEKQIDTNKKKEKPATSTSWSVFDDNYLLHNQKLRDWDKKTEEDEQMEQEVEGEMESYGDW